MIFVCKDPGLKLGEELAFCAVVIGVILIFEIHTPVLQFFQSVLDGIQGQAADTNGDHGISVTDFIQIKAHILGKSQIESK